MAATPRGRDDFFLAIPRRALGVFFAAVFFIFAPIGLLLASSFEQERPWWSVLLLVTLSGLVAISWVAAFTFSRAFAIAIAGLTAALIYASVQIARVYGHERSLQGSLEAVLVIVAIVAGYVLFVVFISGQGRTTMRLMTEMALAQRIHRTLVPRIELDEPALEALGVSVASTEMGGDLVDIVRHERGIELVLADVSGHGVSAGVVMGMIKAALRTELRRPRPLGELMAELNDVLEQTTSPELYATMAAFRLVEGGRALECAFAGHHHALLVRAAAAEAPPERLAERAMPLGLMAGQAYPTRTVATGPGDLLAVYTDGLNETADAADRELGHEPIERAIAAARAEPLAEVQRRVFDLARAHGPQADDRTLLLVRFRSPAGPVEPG